MPVTLKVSTPEGPSGRLFSSADDYLFRYQEGADARAAVSLLMPVRQEEYRHRELHPIFQMNLPEGYVLEQLRNRLAKRPLPRPSDCSVLPSMCQPPWNSFSASCP